MLRTFKLFVLIIAAVLPKALPAVDDHKETSKFYKGVLAVWAIGPLIATFVALFKAYREKKIGKIPVVLFFARWIITGLGVTAGFHRMLTHKAFVPHPLVKLKLLIMGTMAVEGRCIDWECFHSEHHVYADKEGDPHSPHAGRGEGRWERVKGFLHAHELWFFTGDPADRETYGQESQKDPIVVFVDRTAYFWVFLSFLIPYLIGGKKGLLWGGFVGMFFVHHATFAVNSICHTFGSRAFETDDHSRNNAWIAFITLGEGNHNNHHAYPSSPRQGLRGQFDPTWLYIQLLVKLGLATVNPNQVLTDEKAEIIRLALLRKQQRMTTAAQ